MEIFDMYWLVVVLSIAGYPEMNLQFEFSRSYYCNLAKDKFIQADPPTMKIGGKSVSSKIKSIDCEKR
tara:strand:+ start:6909 stop:7112 length:204 start_codon:yes stop_codon:yes gene_type:complete